MIWKVKNFFRRFDKSAANIFLYFSIPTWEEKKSFNLFIDSFIYLFTLSLISFDFTKLDFSHQKLTEEIDKLKIQNPSTHCRGSFLLLFRPLFCPNKNICTAHLYVLWIVFRLVLIYITLCSIIYFTFFLLN